MVVVSQSKIKIEDDDEDDLDALRLAALETLRTKDASYKRSTQKVSAQITQSTRYPYKNQWPTKKNFYYKAQQRQNGVSFQCITFILFANINIMHKY